MPDITGLAEQYGSENRTFTHTWRNADDHTRTSEVTGPDLRQTLLDVGKVARMASEASRSLTIRGEDGWVEETVWQDVEDSDRLD